MQALLDTEILYMNLIGEDNFYNTVWKSADKYINNKSSAEVQDVIRPLNNSIWYPIVDSIRPVERAINSVATSYF